eukprot:UC1_evm1s170
MDTVGPFSSRCFKNSFNENSMIPIEDFKNKAFLLINMQKYYDIVAVETQGGATASGEDRTLERFYVQYQRVCSDPKPTDRFCKHNSPVFEFLGRDNDDITTANSPKAVYFEPSHDSANDVVRTMMPRIRLVDTTAGSSLPPKFSGKYGHKGIFTNQIRIWPYRFGGTNGDVPWAGALRAELLTPGIYSITFGGETPNQNTEIRSGDGWELTTTDVSSQGFSAQIKQRAQGKTSESTAPYLAIYDTGGSNGGYALFGPKQNLVPDINEIKAQYKSVRVQVYVAGEAGAYGLSLMIRAREGQAYTEIAQLTPLKANSADKVMTAQYDYTISDTFLDKLDFRVKLWHDKKNTAKTLDLYGMSVYGLAPWDCTRDKGTYVDANGGTFFDESEVRSPTCKMCVGGAILYASYQPGKATCPTSQDVSCPAGSFARYSAQPGLDKACEPCPDGEYRTLQDRDA